jgi:porphobilinogen synthase
LVRETFLRPGQFVLPLFVDEGISEPRPIGALPGLFRYPTDGLAPVLDSVAAAGLGGVIFFGIPEKKDNTGSGAWAGDGVVQKALAAAKKLHPDLPLFADVCLCEYTSHGHCGLLDGNSVDNDATLELLARTAVSQAAAGADFVAPSDMMDGRVAAIREALDENDQIETGIMAYSAKYASGFYGPFREAAGSAPSFGDRKSYQMDPANGREAIREILFDVEEGADIVMVKPALAYLDVIADAAGTVDVPVAAYNVSGEYAMVKAAETSGFGDARVLALEILGAIARAGADIILTYHALEAAAWLAEPPGS